VDFHVVCERRGFGQSNQEDEGAEAGFEIQRVGRLQYLHSDM